MKINIGITDDHQLFVKSMSILISAACRLWAVTAEICHSGRTIGGYSESVFEKLNVQNWVGMVMDGIRREPWGCDL